MSNTVRPVFGTRTYSTPAKSREERQAGTRSGGFLDLAERAGGDKSDILEISDKAKALTDSQTQAVSGREALESFKEEIWSEIHSMSWGAGISVQITDDAFEKMMKDQDFKDSMMNLIREDACGSHTMCGGTVIRIDGGGYSGCSYMDHAAASGQAAVEAHGKGESAFYVKNVDQKRPDEKLLPRKSDVKRGPETQKEPLSGIAAQQRTELSEAEEMRLFQLEFYQELSQISSHPSISNAAVNISDEAFQAMKEDPEYRAQVLSLLERDLGASVAPRQCSLLITVGKTLSQYRGDSWSVGNDSEFHLRAKDSFYQRKSESKGRQKERLEQYQEKKLQAKRRQQRLQDKAVQERYRLAQIGAQETSFPSITDLLKMRIASALPAAPEAPLPEGTDPSLLNL